LRATWALVDLDRRCPATQRIPPETHNVLLHQPRSPANADFFARSRLNRDDGITRQIFDIVPEANCMPNFDQKVIITEMTRISNTINKWRVWSEQ
jgi:hypothetical protein